MDENIHVNQLFYNFIEEYPDYGPRSKMTISRQHFFKNLVAYSVYKFKCKPLNGRDQVGKWIQFVNASHYLEQGKLL